MTSEIIERAAALERAGRPEQAVSAYLDVVDERPTAAICLGLARCYEQLGDRALALHWALAVVDSGAEFTSWNAATAIGGRTSAAVEPRARARLALLGSYTTNQFASTLWLAARRVGIELEIYEGGYAQYRQEILDPSSGMSGFAPDVVLLALHHGELALPDFSATPEADVHAEVARWTSLWEAVNERHGASVLQHLFALPPEAPFGNLGATLPGAKASMSRDVNRALAIGVPPYVSVVDCDRLAGIVGKRRWFDARYWHLAKQAVALDALPLLARHTTAVLAARLGLGRKCLVLDLDNTLWGGVVGEEGLAGIRLGDTAEGEAFQAFQDAVLALGRRGVVLAVSSKNNPDEAREVFERHPGMRIRLDDVAAFVADWRPKQEQLRSIAQDLSLGLDALVFVDDNPAEREAIRQLVPEVDVIALPHEPARFVEALDDYLLFEPTAFTSEDASRKDHYRARVAIKELESSATTIEDFYESLAMRAVVKPFNDDDLPRIVQLVGKTNQFNLTTRRHSAQVLQAFAADPACVHLSFRLSDRFVDHGLVAVLAALARGTVLEIDTWLMSCRVIGRTLESTMVDELELAALERGCSTLRGVYAPTPRNGLVRDLFPRLGFAPLDEVDGTTTWTYAVGDTVRVVNPHIDVIREWESVNANT